MSDAATEIELRYPLAAHRGNVWQQEWHGMPILCLETAEKAPCPHCGTRTKKFWSLAWPFRIQDWPEKSFSLIPAVQPVYPPGLFVCFKRCEFLSQVIEEETE